MRNTIEFLDHVVEYPGRFKETDLGSDLVQHDASPGEIVQEGTPLNADNMNKLDDGIEDAHFAVDILTQYAAQRREVVDKRLDDHDDEFTAENGTVTLTNSATAFFGFNNSGQTVALQTVRKTMNYDLDIEVTSFSGGQIGDVIVYDRQLNGFKLRFEGSATSVTVKYKVRGGMCA